MDEGWVEQWRDAMRAAIALLLRDFESRFGFPPGEHAISGPSTAAELAGLVARHGDSLPADLLVFHRFVGEVKLPDVNNGYWIHHPPHPSDDPGVPHTLTDGRPIVVFGSDGGGALFALEAASGGPTLRLAGGADINGVYDADRTVVVADNLWQFLTLVRAETEAFVRVQRSP